MSLRVGGQVASEGRVRSCAIIISHGMVRWDIWRIGVSDGRTWHRE